MSWRVGGPQTPKNKNVLNGLKRIENVFSNVGGCRGCLWRGGGGGGGRQTPKNKNVPNGLKRVENVFSSVGGCRESRGRVGVTKPQKFKCSKWS